MQPMNFSNLFSTVNTKEVLTNLPDAVFIVEEDGTVSWVNNRALSLFGVDRASILGVNFEDIVVDGINLAEKSHVRKTSIVTGAITPSNREFFVEINAKRYGMQYFVTLRDTTNMTSILSQSEKTGQMNKEKNLLLYKLSGDFTSPLQSIVGFSQAMIDSVKEESLTAKQEKYLHIINKNSKELLDYLENFFDFSFVESSAFKIKRRIFDIAMMVQNTCREYELNLKGKKLTFTVDVENLKSKTIFSDESAIRLALQKIINLSLMLTEAGVISIEVSTPEMIDIQSSGVYRYVNEENSDYVKIKIKDTGMGISSTEMKNIFNPYALMDSSNKKAISHSVMMSTVKYIINKLGGVIKMSSEIMKGSTFTILLPIAKDKDIDNE